MIAAYLAYYKPIWSPKTWQAEKSRLRKLEADTAQLPPAACLAKWLSYYSPYTAKQNVVRMAHMYDWAIEAGLHRERNEWREVFKRAQAKLKSAYQPKRVSLSFEDAASRVAELAGPVKECAERMLYAGLRFSEAFAASGGSVVGKGNKRRTVFVAGYSITGTSPSKVRRALAERGLRPHDLRKLFLTRCAERGATAQDLCQLAGWSNIQTAYWYLQPKQEDKLRSFVNEIRGER